MNNLKAIFRLLRPKHWVKNLFLYIPLFFAGQFLHIDALFQVLPAFFAFSFCASAIYIFNDYRDVESDKLHPKKRLRPIASGDVSKNLAVVLMLILIVGSFSIGLAVKPKFAFVLGIYFFLNLFYSSGGKKIGILDIFIVAFGFVLRVKAGGVVSEIPVSAWLNVMIFLLALLLTIAKRRDDVIIKDDSGKEMRQSIRNYNLELMNSMIVMVSGIIIVAYLIYTLSPEIIQRFGTHRIYYTSVFVIAGVMRYLQLVFVENDSGSPTGILYKDKFIQVSIALWILSFVFFIYFPDFQLFY